MPLSGLAEGSAVYIEIGTWSPQEDSNLHRHHVGRSQVGHCHLCYEGKFSCSHDIDSPNPAWCSGQVSNLLFAGFYDGYYQGVLPEQIPPSPNGGSHPSELTLKQRGNIIGRWVRDVEPVGGFEPPGGRSVGSP